MKLKFILDNKKLVWATFISTVFTINLAGYLGAYILTNYREERIGLGFPRPENKKTPTDFELLYKRDRLKVNRQEWLEIWTIESKSDRAIGTIILFHGKGSTKSSLLASAQVFNRLDYNTVLVDFRGVGGASGNVTTVGIKESEDVALVVKHIQELNPKQPIILYGISMGSAAILRAIALNNISPDAIILELPFTSLLSAVKTRLKRDGIPSFPLGELMVFWGGIQNGFNGFAHKPINYAKQVNCPTLILQGSLDSTVSNQDIEDLYQNINANKKLVSFRDAGHQLLVTVDRELWQQSVKDFLDNLN